MRTRSGPIRERRRWVLWLAATLAFGVVGACGVEGTDGDTSATAAGSATTAFVPASEFEQQATESLAALEAIYAEVDGLDLEARQARLTELALEEAAGGRPLTIYTGSSFAPELVDRFSEKFGIDMVLLAPGGNSPTAARVTEEVAAGYSGADVIFLGYQWLEGPDGLATAGLFHPIESPYREQLVELAQGETWLAAYLNVSIPVWNTDRITEGPSSWEELLGPKFAQNPDINFAFELEEPTWMAEIIAILVERDGYTEQEAIDLFIAAGRGASYQVGSTIAMTLVAAGQYDMHNNVNQHALVREQFVDAPLGWEPSPEPVLFYTNGAAMLANTTNPAGALLFIEYLVGIEGQQLMQETGRTPSNPNVEGGFPFDKYETRPYSLEALEEIDKWQAIWDEVVAGGTIDAPEG